VSGEASHELPTFHRHLQAGMSIIISRPFGDLAPITSYLSCLADSDYVEKLKEYGLTLEELEDAKNKVVETMKTPNLEIARSISRHCPDYGEKFDANEHITDTVDVSGPGIYVFKEIAEAGKVDISLDRVPLGYEKPVLFATRNYLMDNATAGTNGAIAIIASQGVLEEVESDLRKSGYQPEIIGNIVGRGEGRLFVRPEVEGMISSKSLLEEFTIKKAN
ncbi:MAG: SelD-related putative sulfur metabolism protein, partial [Thaumarchaeota archaeon]|nr:SelD-related putative sulfur metabolism protein [Nitrososphaerota archaeon]